MKNVILILFCLLFFSCANMSENLKFVSKLQDTLKEKYNAREVSVLIRNNRLLRVSFINSVINDKPNAEKQKISLEIGEIVNFYKDSTVQFTQGEVAFIEEIMNTDREPYDSELFDMKLERFFPQDSVKLSK